MEVIMLHQVKTATSSKAETKKKETPQAVKEIMAFNAERVLPLLEVELIVSTIKAILGISLPELHLIKLKSGYLRQTATGYSLYCGKVEATDNPEIFTIYGKRYESGHTRFSGQTVSLGSHESTIIDTEMLAVAMACDAVCNPADYPAEFVERVNEIQPVEVAETVAASDAVGIDKVVRAKAQILDDYLERKITVKEMKEMIEAL